MPSGKHRVHSVSGLTTADGMNPAFSGRHSIFFLISDLYRYYRHITEIAEVHYTPVTLRDGVRRFSTAVLGLLLVFGVLFTGTVMRIIKLNLFPVPVRYR